eukprot:1233604-Rhodomonas_salina.1
MVRNKRVQERMVTALFSHVIDDRRDKKPWEIPLDALRGDSADARDGLELIGVGVRRNSDEEAERSVDEEDGIAHNI